MKKTYESPKFEMVMIDRDEVITTSGNLDYELPIIPMEEVEEKTL